ncbi:hypothetical protein ST201phi2-1p358 [Pseudomonas phage 201phi2-1]|uniref:Uncharacterized protein n=1 Tax=Pseudomonas phage 201phi2-1 TaxID=198110 RepID=B3FJL9_BP201|nr:hypothetical protein ST201phi2-1p358 [Pseudomonas phage 201phi2-1]ABY63184.1 hypothetical protein 201phi2-1p358 [Pseudomonas phage 201phi2-1]
MNAIGCEEIGVGEGLFKEEYEGLDEYEGY